MPDVPKPDLEKIRRIHGSLRHYSSVSQNEKWHRVIIALLVLAGFIGWAFFRHGVILIEIAVVYFLIAVWQGYLTFGGRPLRRRERRRHDDESQEDEA